MTVLIRNPLATDLVLSGFCSLRPGEVIAVPEHIAARYARSIEIVQAPEQDGARRLNLTSTFDKATGYGLGSANLLLGLHAGGLVLNASGDLRPSGDPRVDTLLRHRTDPMPRLGLVRWVPECLSPVRIGWTMWDTTRLPSWWVPILNSVEHVVVPSDGQIETFRESGVTRPMTAVPEPIMLDDYPYVDRPDRDTFTFVSVSRMCSRKCPAETVECFQRAFPDDPDVRLVMKTIGGAFGMGRLGIPHYADPRVTIIDQHWTHDQVVGLLHAADAAVFLSHGEGFYHGAVQAMATGLPTIVPSHSGCAAYADERFNYPVRTAGTERTDYYVKHMGSDEEFHWWVMDYDHAVERMRAIRSSPKKARAKGKKAAAWIRKRFDYAETIKKVGAVLEPYF